MKLRMSRASSRVRFSSGEGPLLHRIPMISWASARSESVVKALPLRRPLDHSERVGQGWGAAFHKWSCDRTSFALEAADRDLAHAGPLPTMEAPMWAAEVD